MAHYVMLNFEDADPGAKAGVVKGLKVSEMAAKGSAIGSAAAGTARIYANRALGKSSIWKSKEVVFYACQEILQRDQNGTLDKQDLARIRHDCQTAKTIAVIVHGTPSDTENGFATTGGAVCTWKELGRLMLLMLPDAGQYNIALVMCYGARSQSADLDHDGHIPVTELVSSFAYKFFRTICAVRKVKMTARTGAVSNDADVNHTVETEEQVFYTLEKQQAQQLRNTNKAEMDRQKTALLLAKGMDAKGFDAELKKFLDQPNKVPVGDVETFAKSYMIYTPYMSGFIQGKHDQTKLGNRSKYGKLIYTYDKGIMEIIARYGTDQHSANYSLYKGPLV